MQYFDKILNIYAYLRSQMQAESVKMRSVAEETLQLHEDIEQTTKDLRQLEKQTDDFLNKTIALANELGIDVSDLLDQETPVSESSVPQVALTDSGRIKFPRNSNFEAEFEKLAQEAHDAGFVDVHPEQLLTDEEIEHANAFSKQLDEEFKAATKLRDNDLFVLMIAIAIRVAYFSLKAPVILASNNAQAPGSSSPAAEPLPDASMGVDIGQVLQQNEGISSFSAIQQQSDVKTIDLPNNLPRRYIPIRSATNILHEHTSFDVDETNFFSQDQILGFDKYLGWFFGVLNIMTDTVTTKSFESYSVARLLGETAKPLVDHKISTLTQFLWPTLRSISDNKDALIASVVREAVELRIAEGDADSVLKLYSRAHELENKAIGMANRTEQILNSLTNKAGQYFGDFAANSLINTLIAAIHSLMYSSADGDLSGYAVRTNKIILYSNQIALIVNSLPALFTKDPTDIDFGGLIATLLSLFHSTAFWINVKADFLVNAYNKELAPYLEQLNDKFDFVD